MSPVELAPFLIGWAAMMAGMMLPSAVPMVRLHHLSLRDAGPAQALTGSALFVSGYLALWSALGVAVWSAGLIVELLIPPGARPYGVALVLVAAGAYQLTSLKRACLRACRTPADFLVLHWYGGRFGALRLGLAHGVHCLGCCVGLMAVFVAAGAMGLLWAVGVAAVIFAEKVLPPGILVARLTGLLLLGGGAAIAARPDLVQLLGGG